MNVIESLLYATAAVLLIIIIHNNHFPHLFRVILAIILFPSFVYAMVILHRALKVLGVYKMLKIRLIKKGSGPELDMSTETEPHRLSNPTQYTPLLQ